MVGVREGERPAAGRTRRVEFDGLDRRGLVEHPGLDRVYRPVAGVAQLVAVARVVDELADQLREVVVELSLVPDPDRLLQL